MSLRPRVFFMVVSTALGISMAVFFLGACGGKKVQNPAVTQEQPAAQASSSQPPSIQRVLRKGRMTLFEKAEERRRCESNPTQCDGNLFDLNIKKEFKTDLEPNNGLSSTVCAGGCDTNSVFQWSLKW